MNYNEYQAKNKIAEIFLQAEREWEKGLTIPRKIIEKSQDILTYVFPSLAKYFDFSAGDYNIRPSTAIKAHEHINSTLVASEHEIIKDIVIPLHNKRTVFFILEMLKNSHPKLQNLSWEQIKNHNLLISKLYSGYMGAGGSWKKWKKSLYPGKIAQLRLNTLLF